MPERTFFMLRYALPGYIFLLTVISLNWTIMYALFSNEDFGALFTALFVFLYLLSGSAIGFLISQLWYVYFHRVYYGKYGVLPEVNRILKDRYQQSLKEEEEIDLHKLQIFSDYIERLSEQKDMLIYKQRRWDLIHLFGSTMLAFPAGLIIGGYFYYIKTGIQQDLGEIITANLSYIVPAALFIAILCVCLWCGLKRAMKENSLVKLILIKEVLKKEKELPVELSDIFPEYFKKSGTSNKR